MDCTVFFLNFFKIKQASVSFTSVIWKNLVFISSAEDSLLCFSYWKVFFLSTFFFLFCYRSIFPPFFFGEQLVSWNAGWSIPVIVSVCTVVVLALCLPWYKSTGKRCNCVFYLLRRQDLFCLVLSKGGQNEIKFLKNRSLFFNKLQCDIWNFGVSDLWWSRLFWVNQT